METALAKAPVSTRPEPLGKREQTKVQNRELILEAARQIFAGVVAAAESRDRLAQFP